MPKTMSDGDFGQLMLQVRDDVASACGCKIDHAGMNEFLRRFDAGCEDTRRLEWLAEHVFSKDADHSVNHWDGFIHVTRFRDGRFWVSHTLDEAIDRAMKA